MELLDQYLKNKQNDAIHAHDVIETNDPYNGSSIADAQEDLSKLEPGDKIEAYWPIDRKNYPGTVNSLKSGHH